MNKNKFVANFQHKESNPFNLYNLWQKIKTESLLYETSKTSSFYSVVLFSVV